MSITQLEPAKLSINNLRQAYDQLGLKGREVTSELCRLEQVASMLKSSCHVMRALAEETGIKVIKTAIDVASQQAGAVNIWIRYIRNSSIPKVEFANIILDLREKYIGLTLNMFKELIEEAEELMRSEHRTIETH